jgi:micrococcal nuclease
MGLLRLLLKAFGIGGRSRRRSARSYYDVEAVASRTPAATWAAPVRTVQVVTAVTGPCYVVDGDTIIIDRRSIRLAGIDAPELDHPYGQNAKWVLIGLCKGHVIRAEFDGSLTHDRDVATCYLPDGRDLSAEMVKAGFAIDWTKFSGGKYRQFEHEGIRKKFWRADARQKGRFPPPPKP